jgi:chemotaxis protein CheD
MAEKRIVVGMADLNCTKGEGIITTLGLGSCIGIALYDHINKVGGLAHIMLPDSTLIKNNNNVAKFADTAIIKLRDDMLKLGANRMIIKAKIAGGAQMFAFAEVNESLRIGERNIEATINILKSNNIVLIGRDTGSNYGRTVELNVATGEFLIKTIGKGNRFI